MFIPLVAIYYKKHYCGPGHYLTGDFNTIPKTGQSGRMNAELIELCQFHDDPSPIADMYRSFEKKTLVCEYILFNHTITSQPMDYY